MTDIFLFVLNMSLNASIVVCMVILLRAVSGKAPKWLRCGLWVLVALRLVCPFSIKASFSILPDTSGLFIRESILNEEESRNEGKQGIDAVDISKIDYQSNINAEKSTEENTEESRAVEEYTDLDYRIDSLETVSNSDIGIMMETNSSSPSVDTNGIEIVADPKTDTKPITDEQSQTNVLDILAHIWLGVSFIMLTYYVLSYIRLKRRLLNAVPISLFDYKLSADCRKVYISENIRTPFVLGVFNPKIYIPNGLDEETLGFVLSHEKGHIKRGDNVWKPLGLTILALHWFNPLVWISYYLFVKDVEAACDEAVIKDKTKEEIKGYAMALLTCSISQNNPFLCSLAFGEISVKKRVKNIAEYRKPKLRAIISLILVCVLISACTMTDPKAGNENILGTALSGLAGDNTSDSDVNDTQDSDWNAVNTNASDDDRNIRNSFKSVNDIRITNSNEIAYILDGKFVLYEGLYDYSAETAEAKKENIPTDGSIRQIAGDNTFITVIDDKGMVYSTFPLSHEDVRGVEKTQYRDSAILGGNVGTGKVDSLIAQDLELMKDVSDLQCSYARTYISVDKYGRVFKNGNRIYAGEKKAIQAVQGFENNITMILLEDGTVITPDYYPSKSTLNKYNNYRLWENVKALYGEGENVIALLEDGSIQCLKKTNEWKVQTWTDIVDISCRYGNIVGLDSSGHVYYTTENVKPFREDTEVLSLKEIQAELDSWGNVLAIDCNSQYIVGLTAEGVKVLNFYR
ncbi:MAG: hypothetical protein K6E47_16645 [Lachnospiraceae bacterium]|nr:hypothetical protein [Lachnospiraceae bacterium]